MARVAVAKRERDGALVALKLILPELAADPEYTTMFVDEARINSRVTHPNVVGVLDVGRDEHTHILFMAMELVLGATLAEVVRSRSEPLPTGVVLEIIAQAADGLAAAHTATALDGTPLEIVHRDVSPQNLLIGFDGVVRISDFGVARASQRATRTKTGQFKGKLRYCAPEQALGGNVDRASDVFALGVVAWELLADRRLFAAPTPFEMLDKIMKAPITSVAELRADLPPDAAALLDAMLQRDRRARPAPTDRMGPVLHRAAADLGADALAEIVRAGASPIACKLAGIAPPESPRAPSRPTSSGVTALARPAKNRQEKQAEDELAYARREPAERTTIAGGWGDPDDP